ncbi:MULTISPECIES: phosphoethanolamine transferase [Psychrobacter]|uniref:phosphoethanolamine transferase n=1 Tax=Psychrobacter TaxID=497 RepID=UPI00146CACD4|nr:MULTISPECIES: phosphoethanolamine transferase [Psychrobacter]
MTFIAIFLFIITLSFFQKFKSIKYRVINIFIVSALLYALLSFYKIIAAPLFILVAAILIIEAYITYKFKDFNEAILEAILNTNKDEALDILKENSLPIAIAIIALCFISYLLFYLTPQNALYSSIFILPLLATFIAAQLRVFKIDKRLKSYAEHSKDFNLINSMDRLDKNVISSIRVKYPLFFGNCFYLLNYRNDYQIDINIDKRTPDFIIKSGKPKAKNIILVIGESANPDRFGICGYQEFNTTPKLSKISKYMIINNVHSLSNMTRTALPFLIAFPKVDNFGQAYTYKNIIDIANEQNFNTFWIGNQAIDSLFTSSYASIAKCANKVFSRDYTSSSRETFNPKDDLDLLPLLASHLQEHGRNGDNSNNLFIVHTIGSHAPYTARSDDIDKSALPNADPYDLSIHHTDRFLNEITDLVKQNLDDYIIVYTSDHGEILVDEGGGLEHGLTFGGYQQYKVPFFILENSSCPLNINRYQKTNGNYSNDMAAFLILETLGLEIQEDYLSKYRKEDKVLHSDYKVYDYEDLPQPSKRK